MQHVTQMLRTHPTPPTENSDALRACIEACFECAQTCTSCADACLAESNVASLVRCIRLNLDCADICEATGRVVTRLTHRPDPVVRAQLQSCIEACMACAEECEMHAAHMEHCRVCAQACRGCEQACRQLLEVMSQRGTQIKRDSEL